MESSVKTNPIPEIFFMVIANFYGIFHCFRSGIGEKSRTKFKLGGDFHKLVMQMRGGGDFSMPGIFAPGANKIAPGIAVRVDGLKSGGQAQEFWVIISQRRAGDMRDKIQEDVPVYVSAEGSDGRAGAVPDKFFMVSGTGGIPPMEFDPFSGIRAGERDSDINLGGFSMQKIFLDFYLNVSNQLNFCQIQLLKEY